MPRSALVVEVPEAEDAVGAWRLRLDANAALGVPAHVTVLFPFVPPDTLDGDALRLLFTGVAAFDYRLVRVSRFGDTVVWLAPEPDTGFQALTRLVADAYPDYPPYEGAFAELVPHLTIGEGGPPEVMREAEREIRGHLPIRATARAVSLLVELPTGRWERAATYPLA